MVVVSVRDDHQIRAELLDVRYGDATGDVSNATAQQWVRENPRATKLDEQGGVPGVGDGRGNGESLRSPSSGSASGLHALKSAAARLTCGSRWRKGASTIEPRGPSPPGKTG